MNADDAMSGRQPLLRPDGQWDFVALAAWFQDGAAYKVAMPDDDMSFLGPHAGDLLITDEGVAPYVGGLALVTDEEMCVESVTLVDRDSAGRLCLERDGGQLVPIEGEDLPFGLVLMVVGYLPLPSGEQPKLLDLYRARTLPREMLLQGPGRFHVTARDLPY